MTVSTKIMGFRHAIRQAKREKMNTSSDSQFYKNYLFTESILEGLAWPDAWCQVHFVFLLVYLFCVSYTSHRNCNLTYRCVCILHLSCFLVLINITNCTNCYHFKRRIFVRHSIASKLNNFVFISIIRLIIVFLISSSAKLLNNH